MVRSRSFVATPPGTTIKEQLTDRGMSQKEFAARMKMTENHISQLINGEIQLTPDMAVKLETVLGIPAQFWNNLEAIYREKCYMDNAAEYVAHRKNILDLLKTEIQSNTSKKYSIKVCVHNPWLVDERLAFCECLSSEIDAIALNKPVAFSDEPNVGQEYEAISILELKNSMENDYTPEENPITEMLEYVDDLRSNKVKDKNGQLIKAGSNTQFYLYAVCDITPTLKKIAEDFDLIETPDKRGMYKYHASKRAYIKILPFDKIIEEAERRSSILFARLGIS